jgi:hypothetical protein
LLDGLLDISRTFDRAPYAVIGRNDAIPATAGSRHTTGSVFHSERPVRVHARTLDRDWPLFSQKNACAHRASSACRPCSPTTRLEARVVQILLGHVNIATTAVYLHLTEPTRASLKATLRQADDRPVIATTPRDHARG